MKFRKAIVPLAIAALAFAGVAHATVVNVTCNGTVEFNEIPAGYPLHSVNPGDIATVSFDLDTSNFLNSSTYPTRGYVIDQASYSMSFPTDTLGLKNPYPAGTTPYFVLRNNDLKVDGFYISDSVDFPDNVTLNQTGVYGNFTTDYEVTYPGTTLPSLNLLDAVGSYDYTGLEVFNWEIDDGGNTALYVDFTNMSISVVPEPATGVIVFAAASLLALRRRSRTAQLCRPA